MIKPSTKMKNLICVLLLLSSQEYTLHCQVVKGRLSDSLCCMCTFVDTFEISKMVYYRPLLKSIDPSYLKKILSLSENIDINKYEKMYYMLNLNKHVKYEVSKILFSLDNSEDSNSYILKQELTSFNNFLKNRIRPMTTFTNECEEKEEIRRYVQKKNLMDQLDEGYLSQFITLTNIINNQDLLDYDAILIHEQQFNFKIALEIRKKNNPGVVLNRHDKELLSLLEEMYSESKQRIEKFQVEKINFNKTPKVISKERLEQAHVKYILKEIIRNSDTILIDKGKLDLIQGLRINEQKRWSRYATPVDSVKELFISLQIKDIASNFDPNDSSAMKSVFYKKNNEEEYIYSYGKIKSTLDLEQVVAQMEKIGIKDFQLIAYLQGEKYPIQKARSELLK